MDHAVQGDAEDLPFATDSFDRYVSAGSIGGHAAVKRATLYRQRWLTAPQSNCLPGGCCQALAMCTSHWRHASPRGQPD